MAYVSKDLKAKLAVQIKEICKKYGVSATIAVRNYSTLVLNVKSGKIDFLKNYRETYEKKAVFHAQWYGAKSVPDFEKIDYIDVNQYRIDEHFSGVAENFLTEVYQAMNAGNHDNSDLQTDYHDIGWYAEIKIGKWNILG